MVVFNQSLAWNVRAIQDISNKNEFFHFIRFSCSPANRGRLVVKKEYFINCIFCELKKWHP